MFWLLAPEATDVKLEDCANLGITVFLNFLPITLPRFLLCCIMLIKDEPKRVLIHR